MKQDVNFSQFCDAFGESRKNQFSYDGKSALFDYLEEYEESTDTEINLDIIALCCEYTEYESVKDYLQNYDTDEELETYEEVEEFDKAVLQEISNKTTLIDVEGEGFIIQSY